MTAEVPYVVAVEDADEGIQVCVLAIELFAPAQAGRARQGLMGGNEDGGGLVHVRKVLAEPFKLGRGEVLGVLAAVVLAGLHTGKVHIVHHDVVDLAEVEGIVVGREVLRVLDGLEVVSCDLHLVVVVAHRMEERDAGEVAVYRQQVIGEAVIVGNPVHVPGHVAKGEHIDLAGGGVHRLAKVACHLFELGKVAGTARQVHVAQHEEGIVVVVRRDKFEILGVNGVLVGGDGFPDLGKDAVGVHLVSGRNGDEYVAPVLFGLDGVVAVGVGLDYLDTVGHEHSGHSCTGACDASADVAGDGRIGHVVDLGLVHPAGGVGLGGHCGARHSAAVCIGYLYAEAFGGKVGGGHGQDNRLAGGYTLG